MTLDVNPYAIHESSDRTPLSVHIEYPGRQIKAQVVFNDEYLLEAFARYNWRDTKPVSSWRIYGNSLLLICIAIGFGLMGSYFVAVALLVLAMIVPLIRNLGGLSRYLIKRRFKSSPHRNEQLAIVFADEGVFTRSSLQESRLGWAGFLEAAALSDGVLLMESKTEFRWIPFSCLEDRSDVPILYNYLASRIAANKSQSLTAKEAQ